MTQFGRPDSDISVGSWNPFPASPTTLFDKINEETPNGDTDYIYSSVDEDECEISVGAVVDPEIGTGHKIRCTAQCPLGSGQPEALWIALVENGTIRGQSAATTVNRNNYVMIEYVLSEAEANAIGNYANLRLRFHITKVNGGEPIQITQAEFECPDATEEHSGSSSISGNGSLAGVAKKGGKQSSLISAKGALVAIGLVATFGIASISGGGVAATVGQKAAQVDVTIPGGGVVATTGTKAEGEPHSGSASISGNGAVTVQGIKGAEDTGAISGNGAATAQGIKGAEDAGAVSGGGEISSSGEKAGEGTAEVTGNGSIIAAGTKIEGEEYFGSAIVSGGGTVSSDGEKGAEESPAVFGNGNTIAAGTKETFSFTSITGNGALASIGKKETEGTGLISGNGSINTAGMNTLYLPEQRSLGAKKAGLFYPRTAHPATKRLAGGGYKKWL